MRKSKFFTGFWFYCHICFIYYFSKYKYKHIYPLLQFIFLFGREQSVCPMSLDVEALVRKGDITDNDCILCGKCIDTCKRGTIEYAWKLEKEEV